MNIRPYEAYENFMIVTSQSSALEKEIAHLLAASFFIKKTHKGSRSLFFLVDSEEKDEVTKSSGGFIFFIR